MPKKYEVIEDTCDNCIAKELGFCTLKAFDREECKENLWVAKLYKETQVAKKTIEATDLQIKMANYGLDQMEIKL